MIFNEKEMLEVCQKYGIGIIEKEGGPLYDGQEMDDNFSMYDIMHDTYSIVIDEKTLYSQTLELKMPVIFESNDLINCFMNDADKPHFINVDKDDYYKSVKSSVTSSNDISFAA